MAGKDKGLLHKMVVIGGAAGLAILALRTARLFAAGLVLGLEKTKKRKKDKQP